MPNALVPPATLMQMVMVGPCDDIENVNFLPGCLASIVGTIWKDPLGDCDGHARRRGGDAPANVRVDLAGRIPAIPTSR